MTGGPQVLVVDDEEDLAGVVARYLSDRGLETTVVHDGPSALRAAHELRPDVVVLDLMLPGMDGIAVAGHLRADGDAVILMLTARDSEEDVLAGLAAGADDYVTKPFSPRILAARVEALLRRPRRGGAATATATDTATATRSGMSRPVRVADLVLDPDGRTLRRDGVEVSLTRSEFDVLWTVIRAGGRAVSRAEILESMWGRTWFGDDHVVDVHIANVRRKLGPDPSGGRYVETVRGVGYRVEVRRSDGDAVVRSP
jgi:DNA-binding response OmpR family regulator